MKRKQNWSLCLKPFSSPECSTSSPKSSRSSQDSPNTPSASSTPIASSAKKKTPTRHLSLHHEKEQRKKRDEKKKELEEAVAYCKEKNCKGYKAIKELELQHIKDPRTINQHLAKNVITGEEWSSQRILTKSEERSLVRYLINKNRACPRTV